jgi:hypothetical protein
MTNDPMGPRWTRSSGPGISLGPVARRGGRCSAERPSGRASQSEWLASQSLSPTFKSLR